MYYQLTKPLKTRSSIGQYHWVYQLYNTCTAIVLPLYISLSSLQKLLNINIIK